MNTLHENQRKILELLLKVPAGATLDEVSEHIEVTKTAAKEHILKLEALGFIGFMDSKGFVGRPRRRYLLSVQGREAFPRQYSWLATILLELLAQEMGSTEVQEIMRRLADKIAASMAPRFERAESSAQRLVLVTEALNELGYKAVLKQSDLRKGAVIEAVNCVYHSVAKTHQELCNFDVRFIENSTGGMNVKLEKCIARGDSVCRFCIRKK